ncbi:hypothetical protein QUC31_003921 [Theobroma cacao]
MKFYISTTGIKRVTISNSTGGGGGGKGATVALTGAAAARGRLSSRTVLPVVLVLGIVLPFLFVRIAFLVLESASSSSCSSPIDCIGWRLFSGGDTSQDKRIPSVAFLDTWPVVLPSYYVVHLYDNVSAVNALFDASTTFSM